MRGGGRGRLEVVILRSGGADLAIGLVNVDATGSDDKDGSQRCGGGDDGVEAQHRGTDGEDLGEGGDLARPVRNDGDLARAELDNESAKHVKSHPLFGSLFENLVIMEFVKYRFNQGKQSNHYFYQDRTHEIDLVSKVSDKLISTEIKSAKTFHESFFRNLDYFESIFQDQLIKKAIVYGGEKSQNRSKASIINPWDITKFSEEFI
jgi:hypothetical protein